MKPNIYEAVREKRKVSDNLQDADETHVVKTECWTYKYGAGGTKASFF